MKSREEELLLEYSVSKLCHDLAGTIGGIANSIEFLSDDNPALREHAELLLKNTAKQLMDQFQFFRKLYGYVDIELSGILYQFLELAVNYLQYQKIEVKFDQKNIQEFNESISGINAKIIINTLYLLSKYLIGGGSISLKIENNDSMVFNIKGQNIKFDNIIEEIINNKIPEISVNTVTAQILYILKLINYAQLKFSLIEKKSEEITLTLTKI